MFYHMCAMMLSFREFLYSIYFLHPFRTCSSFPLLSTELLNFINVEVPLKSDTSKTKLFPDKSPSRKTKCFIDMTDKNIAVPSVEFVRTSATGSSSPNLYRTFTGSLSRYSFTSIYTPDQPLSLHLAMTFLPDSMELLSASKYTRLAFLSENGSSLRTNFQPGPAKDAVA